MPINRWTAEEMRAHPFDGTLCNIRYMITTCYLIKWENACIMFSEEKQNKIECEELSNIFIR